MSIGDSLSLKRWLAGGAVCAALAIPALAPSSAEAYWVRRCCWRPGVVVVRPPVVYAPPPVAYVGPPRPWPYARWVPGHYNRWGRWIPPHWV